MKIRTRSCTPKFFFAYAGGFISMFGFFVATMLIHEQRLNFEYLQHATPRILAISLLPGLLGVVLRKHGKLFLFLTGIITGPFFGAAYINIVLWIQNGN